MSLIPNPLIIASRGSKLALWQANYAKSFFETESQKVELNIIKTTGDRVQDRFLHEIGGKGVFIRELEQALMANEAHLAVHSLKDLPAKIPEGFKLASIHKRHQPTDIMIFNPKSLDNFTLPEGDISKEGFKNFGPFTVATGSLRRASLLKNASQQVKVVPIRGNVDTRIQKLLDGDWDGLILAEASLERLQLLNDYTVRRLSPEWFVPSAAQGALAIETLDNNLLDDIITPFTCGNTSLCVELERSVLAALGGDCTMPFGCHFHIKDQELKGDIIVLNNEGEHVRHQYSHSINTLDSQSVITENIVKDLRNKGVEKILKDLNITAPFME